MHHVCVVYSASKCIAYVHGAYRRPCTTQRSPCAHRTIATTQTNHADQPLIDRPLMSIASMWSRRAESQCSNAVSVRIARPKTDGGLDLYVQFEVMLSDGRWACPQCKFTTCVHSAYVVWSATALMCVRCRYQFAVR